MNLPPFPDDYPRLARAAARHIIAAPYGIGDLGPAAVAWIQRLHDAGQGWWQLLPLGPTGYGDSPYQPLSSTGMRFWRAAISGGSTGRAPC
jgi:4-alpha-glucanotransferase